MAKVRALVARVPALELLEVGCLLLITAGIYSWTHPGALVAAGVMGCVKVFDWERRR